jgi:hypothetical protein
MCIGQKGVLFGNRHGRYAGILRTKRQQCVIDGIAGKDGDRSVGAKLPRGQHACDVSHKVEGLPIADFQPTFASVVTLGKKGVVGCRRRPSVQPVRGAIHHGIERQARGQDQGAALFLGSD